MKKIIVFALAMSVFFGVATAHAEDEEFNVLDLECQETFSDEEMRHYFTIWMTGYLGAKHNDTMYSPEILQALQDRTGKMCQERPDATLGDIVEHLSQ